MCIPFSRCKDSGRKFVSQRKVIKIRSYLKKRQSCKRDSDLRMQKDKEWE